MDYSQLSKEELISRLIDLEEKIKLENKQYGLVWEKKKEFIPKMISLEKIEEKCIYRSKEKPTHCLIEGENLYALHILKETHKQYFDMICIDPPYFTKNKDLRYTDHFLNQKSKFKYSEWLNFIYNRINIAKELLKEEGIFVVHIDEKMHPYLRLLLNEIFGEKNFVADIIWQNKYCPSNDKKTMSIITEYILVYAKNIKLVTFSRTPLKEEYISKSYRNPDNDERGLWRTVELYKDKNPKTYKVIAPNGTVWEKPWNVTPETFQKLIEDNRIWWGKDGTSIPRKKLFYPKARVKF